MLEKPVTSRADPESRKAYTRWHYQNNAAQYKARAVAKNEATRAAVKSYLFEYLQSHSCLDCGESDPIVLEFDHRPEEVKRFTIGDAVRRVFCLKSVIEEVSKCDVRCANCHRRITYRRAGRTHRGILL